MLNSINLVLYYIFPGKKYEQCPTLAGNNRRVRMTGETQGGQSASTLGLAGTQALCSADYDSAGGSLFALGALLSGGFY